jgi:membrane associated rhomboid family serine protease
MDSITEQLHFLVYSIQLNAAFLGAIIGIFWLILIINAATSYQLNRLGIYPRRFTGLIGIVTSPFLHGGFSHLLFNTIPFFILANFVLLEGQETFIIVSLLIMLAEGLGVWLLGREALHVGASGLVMGYWGYLVIGAYQSPALTSMFLLVICFYYFGGFISSLLPEEGSSWEGHVFGLLAGMAVSYFHLAQLISG